MTSFSCPQTLAGNDVGGGPLFGVADGGKGSVMSSHVCNPPTTGPGAPTDVATKNAKAATGPSSSMNAAMPASTVDGGKSVWLFKIARSGTFATARLPGAPWSTPSTCSPPSGSVAPWMPATSTDARMRGFSTGEVE